MQGVLAGWTCGIIFASKVRVRKMATFHWILCKSAKLEHNFNSKTMSKSDQGLLLL